MNKEPATEDYDHRIRTAKLFRNGQNQAVRLPIEFEIHVKEVIIHPRILE